MSKQDKTIEWLDESTAAGMLNLTAPYFRRSVMEGKLSIVYSRPSGKLIMYSKESIEEHITRCSTLSQKQTRSATRQAQTVN